jgi:hypothetical protein
MIAKHARDLFQTGLEAVEVIQAELAAELIGMALQQRDPLEDLISRLRLWLAHCAKLPATRSVISGPTANATPIVGYPNSTADLTDHRRSALYPAANFCGRIGNGGMPDA